MKQLSIATQRNINYQLNRRKNNPQFYETGQLRRARMHAARLIETLDGKRLLTPFLRELLEASLTLETTNTRILAAYLKRSPATIRSEFQKICTTLEMYAEFSKDYQKQSSSMVKKSA
ncbi:hypothetical protein [Nitrosomonas ureae]|uniref:Uncharacterized protein n=1 Tax=Nitrosomonas ureae TaxID=44577 RepID=A0A1H9EU37_9PROT|nr:hypothetical protein [Nitrosomonas ureae]SEQ29165.1 hypothetical protein SAMN05421510_103433 [Nitrosomonas ureae]